MDHQMNQELFKRFSQIKATVPITRSPTIRQANALRIDWNEVLPAADCAYVLGNPPFVGKQFATADQKADMFLVFDGLKGAGVLDYVTSWYMRAAQYVGSLPIRCAFVSTNSITQGEQVGVLWNELFRKGVKIHFGHRTFSWESEARGKAHVHVVIIGFGLHDTTSKRIYDYELDPESPSVIDVRNISPYLVEAGDVVVMSRSRPLCNVPEIVFGNMPNDGGHLLLNDQERQELLNQEPKAKKYIRPLLGSQEFINGETRWCLWLVNASPAELRDMTQVMRCVEGVRRHRSASKRQTTRELAKAPMLFGEIRQPSTRYLLVPSVSSENRPYIPMGFMPPTVITNNLALMIPSATLYHFGILSSAMHMAWVRQVCGRLESRYRYSNTLVYNNYPWPQEVSDKRKTKVEQAAQAVLDARAAFTDSTLADLYDPLAMPARLVKAHAALDRAVDACYRSQPFTTERLRVEYLFSLYERLTAPLTGSTRPARRRR
jgi:hypothetical protein